MPNSLHFTAELNYLQKGVVKILHQAGYLQQFLIKEKININNERSHFYPWAVRQLISAQ